MAYNNAIPQAADTPAASQPQLLANFQAIKTLIDVNHVTFDAANQGKHNHVTLPNQLAAPATAATECALFSRLSSLTGVSEVCIRKQGSGVINELSYADSGVDGWARLSSGLLIKWGVDIANGSTAFLFPVGATIPAFTSVFSGMATAFDPVAGDTNVAVTLKSINALGFTCFGSARTTVTTKAVPFSYLIIGI